MTNDAVVRLANLVAIGYCKPYAVAFIATWTMMTFADVYDEAMIATVETHVNRS
jgi:hypothetical protein